jgi:hypothetical protein
MPGESHSNSVVDVQLDELQPAICDLCGKNEEYYYEAFGTREGITLCPQHCKEHDEKEIQEEYYAQTREVFA